MYRRICIAFGTLLGETTSCCKSTLSGTSALLSFHRTGSSMHAGFLDEGNIALRCAIFFPGNMKMKTETKKCLSPSRSPTAPRHDLKNKARSKAALAVLSKLPEPLQPACSSACGKSPRAGSWLRWSAGSWEPGWQLHLTHSYKLFLKQFPSHLHFHLGDIDYSKSFLFNIFPSSLFTLRGVKVN